jgi:hypothetical protein
MVEGTVESKLTTIDPRPPACKYKKSTSRMPGVGRGIPRFGGSSSTKFTLPGGGKAHAAGKHVREYGMGSPETG